MAFKERSLYLVPPEGESIRSSLSSLRGNLRWNDFLTLFKPGIIFLVGVTTLTGSHLADPEKVFHRTTWFTLIGVVLSAMSSAVFNNTWDRERDRRMGRTARRPMAVGAISPSLGYFFSFFLLFLSSLFLLLTGGFLSLLLTFSAWCSYALLYTIVLKPRTPLATEVGGFAGTIPPLVGWFSAGGELSPFSFFLPLLLFLWQPPHFWILSLGKREEYRKAGIPTMIVVSGDTPTLFRILGYHLLAWVTAFLPYFYGIVPQGYLYGNLIFGGIFVLLTLLLFSTSLRGRLSFPLFLFSNVYLLLICFFLWVF